MNWLIDTCVWSLALRRTIQPNSPEIQAFHEALMGEGLVFTTGIILQELLQGFDGPKARSLILEHFDGLAFVQPDRNDHIAAADIRNTCRQHGVQIGTVDALLIRLSQRHELTLLTTDRDFLFARRHLSFPLWPGPEQPRH